MRNQNGSIRDMFKQIRCRNDNKCNTLLTSQILCEDTIYWSLELICTKKTQKHGFSSCCWLAFSYLKMGSEMILSSLLYSLPLLFHQGVIKCQQRLVNVPIRKCFWFHCQWTTEQYIILVMHKMHIVSKDMTTNEVSLNCHRHCVATQRWTLNVRNRQQSN